MCLFIAGKFTVTSLTHQGYKCVLNSNATQLWTEKNVHPWHPIVLLLSDLQYVLLASLFLWVKHLFIYTHCVVYLDGFCGNMFPMFRQCHRKEQCLLFEMFRVCSGLDVCFRVLGDVESSVTAVMNACCIELSSLANIELPLCKRALFGAIGMEAHSGRNKCPFECLWSMSNAVYGCIWRMQH